MTDGGNERGFGQLLQNLEDGQLLVALGDKLQEMNDKLAKQEDNVGKAKGELTLKLKLTCDSQGGTVMIDSEMVVKETKLPLREVSFTKANRDALKEAAKPVAHDEDGVVAEGGSHE